MSPLEQYLRAAMGDAAYEAAQRTRRPSDPRLQHSPNPYDLASERREAAAKIERAKRIRADKRADAAAVPEEEKPA